MARYRANILSRNATKPLLLLLFVSLNLHECYGASVDFIRVSCNRTTYPSLCFSSLSRYASDIGTSPTKLARTAISLSLDRARSLSVTFKGISTAGMARGAAGAVRDCVETVEDSVYELQESVAMMGQLKGRDVGFRINSIQTWLSAALTDYDTCMEGLSEPTKGRVRSRMLEVTQMTSNALALVNLLV